MDKSEIKEQTEQLCEVLARTNDPEQVMALLEDLCTPAEIEQMAQRVECARLLLLGNTYSKIIAQTDISSATLSRISRCIQHGSGGYSKILQEMVRSEE